MLEVQPSAHLAAHDHVDSQAEVASCRVDELRAHPIYLKHQIAVSVPKLSALAERGDQAFREPLMITHEHIILDGYARWKLALSQDRSILPCIMYALTEENALRWILQTHRRSDGLSAFNRILLALEFEPLFKEKALSNQRSGGQHKGSSKLTEADRLDVRSEIAAAAGVSLGNVSKVKHLLTAAQPDILEALKSKEISIHRAWTWSQMPPEKQLEALWWQRTKKGLNKTTQELVSRHRPKRSLSVPDPGELANRLAALRPNQISSLKVSVVKGHGKAIYLTEDLALALDFPQMDICEATSR
jgi:hypothetical protein